MNQKKKEEKEAERGKKIGTKSHRVSRRWWEYRKLSWNILIYEYLWKSLYVLLLLLRLLLFSLFLPNINSKHTPFKYACVLGLVIVMGESEREREWNESFFFFQKHKKCSRTDDKITKCITKKLTAQNERSEWNPRWRKKNIAHIMCGIMNKIKRFIEMQAKSKLFNKSFLGCAFFLYAMSLRLCARHTHIRHCIQLRELNISPLWKSQCQWVIAFYHHFFAMRQHILFNYLRGNLLN